MRNSSIARATPHDKDLSAQINLKRWGPQGKSWFKLCHWKSRLCRWHHAAVTLQEHMFKCHAPSQIAPEVLSWKKQSRFSSRQCRSNVSSECVIHGREELEGLDWVSPFFYFFYLFYNFCLCWRDGLQLMDFKSLCVSRVRDQLSSQS